MLLQASLSSQLGSGIWSSLSLLFGRASAVLPLGMRVVSGLELFGPCTCIFFSFRPVCLHGSVLP